MLLEFGLEHLNTLSITPEILVGHTWLLLQLRYSLNLYVVSQLTWGKNKWIDPSSQANSYRCFQTGFIYFFKGKSVTADKYTGMFITPGLYCYHTSIMLSHFVTLDSPCSY